VEVTTDEDNVPKVIRMFVEEVENRGLDSKGIYLVSRPIKMCSDLCLVSQSNPTDTAEVLEASGICRIDQCTN
jgi:hypothetical protein